jgi:CheY-like chemotaxis protein
LNDILDFSKVEREKERLEVQTFYLRNCIEEAMEIVAAKAAAKKLNLAYQLDKVTPVVIIGDSSKLRHILVNLLDYAIRFSERGEVALSVSSKRLDPSYEIHFEIGDTGLGMHRFILESLSGSPSKVEGSRKDLRREEDLLITKELIELMGGRIWVESRVGEGSAIHFTIKTQHLRSMLPLAGVQPQFDGKRILILESASTTRDILAAQALEWGMRPAVAGSSQEALKLMKSDVSFDIALLDIDLPGDNVSSLAREIRKLDAGMLLIALAFAGQKIESDLFVRGLTKPVRQSDFYNALKAAFAEKPALRDQELAEKGAGAAPLRILLAEDNISNQKVILALLKRLGYDAYAVANGKEALSALEAELYDVVFMDVRMPEMDGLEATRIIRKRWPDKGPKIVAITAYAMTGDRERCLEAGMDDYVSKPVRLQDLALVLSKMCLR